MAKVSQFSAPGNLKDLDASMAASWSAKISGFLDAEVAALAANPGLQPQFYNASKLDVSGTPTPISWPAFPQIIEINFGDNPQEMFSEAENRDNQDEYLEWAAHPRAARSPRSCSRAKALNTGITLPKTRRCW